MYSNVGKRVGSFFKIDLINADVIRLAEQSISIVVVFNLEARHCAPSTICCFKPHANQMEAAITCE